MAESMYVTQLEEQLYALQSFQEKLRETSEHHGKLLIKILQCLENLQTAHSLARKASQTDHVVVHIESEEEDFDTLLSLEKRWHRRKRRPTQPISRGRRILIPFHKTPAKVSSFATPILDLCRKIRKKLKTRRRDLKVESSSSEASKMVCITNTNGFIRSWLARPSSKRARPSAVPTSK